MPATNNVGAGGDRTRRSVPVDPAVDLEIDRLAERVDAGANVLDLASWSAMKDCPPKPGSTVITSTRSRSPSRSQIASAGVAGLIESPAFLPQDLIRSIVARISASASHAR